MTLVEEDKIMLFNEAIDLNWISFISLCVEFYRRNEDKKSKSRRIKSKITRPISSSM